MKRKNYIILGISNRNIDNINSQLCDYFYRTVHQYVEELVWNSLAIPLDRSLLEQVRGAIQDES